MAKLTTGGVAGDQLKGYIERIERLEDQKTGFSIDIKDVFAEAKCNGFDVKAMRQVIKLRRIAASERIEMEYTLDLYLRAIGMTETE